MKLIPAKCKCGNIVLISDKEQYKDGDLIPHFNCVLRSEK